MKGLIKYILIGIGSISLGLGFIGIFMPILPTTPFVLLTFVCYIKSSEKLAKWLLTNKRFGPYIDNYINNKAITRKARNKSIATLWIGISLSIYLADITHLKIFLLVVGIGVSAHLLSLNLIEGD
jgi:hypothetical protein